MPGTVLGVGYGGEQVALRCLSSVGDQHLSKSDTKKSKMSAAISASRRRFAVQLEPLMEGCGAQESPGRCPQGRDSEYLKDAWGVKWGEVREGTLSS